MNKEVRDLWTAALRSGDYKQGYGALAKGIGSEVTYCCLGVLCELAVEAGVIGRESTSECDCGCSDGMVYDGEVNYLPKSVMEWAEINWKGWFGDEFSDSLTHLNDVAYISFQGIARVIEEEF